MPPATDTAHGPDAVFVWHPDARLFDADGLQVPKGVVPFTPRIADRPAGAALASALEGQGAAFRIGGTGDVADEPGMFETLTGGSLGTPRRIRRSQASWLASFAVNAGLFGIGPGMRVGILGRLSHSLALYGALEGVCLGAEVHLLDGLRPDRQALALVARGISLVYATPAQLRLLIEDGEALPELRQVVVGGAKLDARLRAALVRVAPGLKIHEFYGAAEASFITLADPEAGSDTVGLPYPGVSLRILDAAGHRVLAGRDGEVWVKSPYLFQSYAGDDPGSACWRDGWLSVGEIGAMTAAGLILRGRAKRMLTVADRNVFPEEIEAYLATLPGIARVAVLPVPDAARGHVLVAVAQGDCNAEAEILAAARARLGTLIAPKALIWRKDWPVLASGKTDLLALYDGVPEWR